ncbi:MAG: autotransporter outer membrane beta-barrel domain-containing protein [Steroidobacteraceae bacterium]
MGTGDVTVTGGASSLQINRSDTLTLGQVIAGTGRLVQAGTGTTILTGANTRTGTTTISAGTLQIGDGGTIGNLGTGAVTNNSALVVNRSDALTLAQVISGSGTFTQAGTGTTLLTANNTYTGTTTITDGSLQVGNGGTTGRLGTGAVVNNGSLVINRSNALTLAQAISGSGTLTQAGTGTTSLTGTNSYTGTTTITGGTLRIGNGGTTGTLGVGAVTSAAGASLAFNRSDTISVANFITGAGTLAQIGSGTTVLTNANTAGATTIARGVLDVSGTLTTPTITMGGATSAGLTVGGTVGAGGTSPTVITGTGTAPNTVTVNAGGMLYANTGADDLGAGGDTLNVAGTLNTGGGTFNLGAGNDMLIVAGTVEGSGTMDLADGDDLLTLNDGALLYNTISGGGHVAGDTVVLNNANPLSLDASRISNFEILTKQNTGTATLTDNFAFVGGVNIAGGTLDVTGTLETPTVMLADATTLNVDGALLAAGAGPTTITGSNGVNSLAVSVGATLVATGDLGDGADVFDLAGTLDTGAGTFMLGAGDDVFVVHDTTNVIGTLDAGTGDDFLNVNVGAGNTAALGSSIGFESLAKSGPGALQINGPSGFLAVDVQDGVMQVASAGSVSAQTTTVAAGSTLQVDGGYGGTAGNDLLTVAGTLSGAGTVSLLGGDDTLRVVTGATISLSGSIDADDGDDQFVLDGTGSDSFDVGQIGLTYLNFEQFAKEGDGSWRLTGAGAQNWTVSGGTLIGDTSSLGGNIVNHATVVFDQATDGTYAGILSGSGALIKLNAGTLILSGNSPFSGNTSVVGGILEVNGSLSSSNVMLDSGTTLSGVGTVGSLITSTGAWVVPGNSSSPFGTLTIAGNYSGSGTVRINTFLGDESSQTSRLVITGDSTGASSLVVINPVGGNGQGTSGDGIELIQVDGLSPADSFRLAQPVQAGAYEYRLHQGGTADSNDWFLRTEFASATPAFRPAVPGYALGNLVNLESGFAALGSLRTRVGNQGSVHEGDGEHGIDGWMRVRVQELSIESSRFQMGDGYLWSLQFGTDLLRREFSGRRIHAGIMASVGEDNATFFDPARALAGLETRTGTLDATSRGVGGYFTRYGANGGYFDLAAQAVHFENRYRDQFATSGEQSGWGSALSAEIGSAFSLGSTNWKIERQLQLTYQRLELGRFADEVSNVSAVEDDALRGRLGVRIFADSGQWLGLSQTTPYVLANFQRDFHDDRATTVGSTEFSESIPRNTLNLGAGLTGTLHEGVQIHFDLRYQNAIDGTRDGFSANLSLRIRL